MLMARSLVLSSLALPLVLACGDNPPPQPVPVPTPPASTTAAPVASTPMPEPSASATPPAEPPKPPPPTPAAKWEGFATPESVYYDADNDRYLVTSINGRPDDTDNNGFISWLNPDGTVKHLKWIEGAPKKVKLDSPKGMTIVKGVLYVADVSVVRMFDAKSGAAKGEIKVDGATFLNDVTSGPDGRVYVSDTGVKVGANGFEPTGTDAVWVIEKGKAKPLAKTTDLGRPNGLVVTDKGVLCVTFGSGELYRIDDKGQKADAMKLPKGQLDGIVAIGGGKLLVSSWEGAAVMRGTLGGTFEVVVDQQRAPADIGWDSKRNRVLVPHFTENTVEAYEVK
jgi:hypothetical protein